MTDIFFVKRPIYPLLGIFTALLTLVGALFMARSAWGGVFVICVWIMLLIFGYAKTCIRILPFCMAYVLLFSLIFYLASGGDVAFTGQMAIRLAGVAVAIIPGLSLAPIKLSRNLTALKVPRLFTLGMLVTLAFVPVLAQEIRQVRDAMRTRGITSIFNLSLFYRAFLIPLIVRLVNISDTLSLSVETRGFVSDDRGYTIFHPIRFTVRDGIFAVLFICVFIVSLAFSILGVVFPWQP